MGGGIAALLFCSFGFRLLCFCADLAMMLNALYRFRCALVAGARFLEESTGDR